MAFRKPFNKFIDPALAEERHVQCGWCGEDVLGHLQGCPHCKRPFYANMHGYARICKNDSCRRTETAGHAHGLCRFHFQDRERRRASTALLPKCACGSVATHGYVDCRRCREIKEAAANYPRRPGWSPA